MKDTSQNQQENYKFENLVSTIHQYEENYINDITQEEFFGFPMTSILNAESQLLNKDKKNHRLFFYGIWDCPEYL